MHWLKRTYLKYLILSLVKLPIASTISRLQLKTFCVLYISPIISAIWIPRQHHIWTSKQTWTSVTAGQSSLELELLSDTAGPTRYLDWPALLTESNQIRHPLNTTWKGNLLLMWVSFCLLTYIYVLDCFFLSYITKQYQQFLFYNWH